MGTRLSAKQPAAEQRGAYAAQAEGSLRRTRTRTHAHTHARAHARAHARTRTREYAGTAQSRAAAACEIESSLIERHNTRSQNDGDWFFLLPN
jgi:hypothetical protein